MQSKTIWLFTILLVIATLFSVLTLASGTTLPENTTESGFDHSSSSVSGVSNDGRYILLKAAQFNTEEVTFASSMASTESISPSENDEYYIVQFKGFILEEWKQDVRNTGAIIFDYVPNNAFIVRMNASVKAEVENLDSVQWIGSYHPSYRISPMLSSISEEAGQVDLIVMLFDSEDNERILNEITGLGGEIVDDSGDIIRVKIDRTKISDIAALDGVSWIEKYLQPVILNDVAAGIINVSYVQNTHGLTGSGQIVAVADTGLDSGFNNESMHDDLEGRIVAIRPWWGSYNDSGGEDNDGHGTHVAGSVLGNGLLSNGLYAGMAPEAQLVFQSMQYDGPGPLMDGFLYFPIPLSLVFQEAYDDGARIHSDSWGNDTSTAYGNYTLSSHQVDSFMWDNPDFLIVFSAGNEAGTSGTCTPPGTAKNALTVGASENYRPYMGGLADDIDDIASFSSRGPTDDGRIKPDVVAPGTYIISTRSSMPDASYSWGIVNEYYANSSGTSMSTPLTAGTAALVRQYYVENESISPSAALLKATLINGAVDIGQSINAQGWGRVDLEGSLFPPLPQKLYYHDNINLNVTTDSWNNSYYLNNSSAALKMTLVWTDHPPSNASDPVLVNDLDLIVTGPSGTYLGNDGDHTNNVEQVELSSPSEGWYTVTVNGFHVPDGPQPFALVLSGAFGNDTTAPASVTSLDESSVSGSSITWNWTNPADPDFNHTMIYLNNVFTTNVSDPDSSYVATGLDEATIYQISTRTVDTDGNINITWVNDTATTLDLTAPASVTSLDESSVSGSSITWNWTNPADPDFSHTMIYLDNVFTANVSDPDSSYVATGLDEATIYQISTRTVDTDGNINTTWVNDTATTLDLTAPASVTNLDAIYGETWINWSWINPSDVDLNHTMIYIDNVFKSNVSSTTIFYNATDLSSNTLHTISTQTVDITGNINSSWTNSSVSTGADTTAPSSITGLAGTPGETWINWSWTNPSDPDFNHTMIYIDDVFKSNVSSTTIFYNATDLSSDTLHTISTQTVDIIGNINSSWTNSTAKTSSQNSGGTSGSSSSGGGGSSTTSEDFENIELKDVVVRYITNNLETSFMFKNENLDIIYINISTDKTIGDLKAIVESLRSTSSLASKPAEGRIYKNINIWVGNAGLKSNLRISDVGFRVDRVWLDENGVSEYSVRLSTYRNGNWYVLPTERVDEDDNYVYYETDTSGELLSPFAIVEYIESKPVSLTTGEESVVEGSKVPEPVRVNPALDPSAEGTGIRDGAAEEPTASEFNTLFFAVPVIVLISVSFVAVRRGYHIKAREKAVGFLDNILMEKDNDSRTSSDKEILHKDVPEGPMEIISPAPEIETKEVDIEQKLRDLEESGLISGVVHEDQK